MSNEEALKLATGLRTDFKCESDTMVDFCNTIIKALEREPVLDKIKAEIEEHAKINQNINTDRARALCWCLDVIDKYNSKSEG